MPDAQPGHIEYKIIIPDLLKAWAVVIKSIFYIVAAFSVCASPAHPDAIDEKGMLAFYRHPADRTNKNQ